METSVIATLFNYFCSGYFIAYYQWISFILSTRQHVPGQNSDKITSQKLKKSDL
jgi:hypothetical protein